MQAKETMNVGVLPPHTSGECVYVSGHGRDVWYLMLANDATE